MIRSDAVKLRVSPAEKAALERRARERGEDLSTFIRRRCLEGDGVAVFDALGPLDGLRVDGEPALPDLSRHSDRVAELMEQGLPRHSAERVAELEVA